MSGSKLYSPFYVYTLTDPRCGSVFYVGKGKGKRHAAHVAEWKRGIVSNPDKYSRIAEIVLAGFQVQERVVSEFDSEQKAFDAERALIAEIGLDNLTNIRPGGGTAKLMTLEEYRAEVRKIFDGISPFEWWFAARKRTAREVWWWAKIVLDMARDAGLAVESHLLAVFEPREPPVDHILKIDALIARARGPEPLHG